MDGLFCLSEMPKIVLLEGGFFTPSDHAYHFQVTDRQGNVRLVTGAGGTVEQSYDYHPYGEEFSAQALTGPANAWRYGGKEKETVVGTRPQYDFGARRMSPAYDRFITMDPLGEKYYHISPYVFCAGDPVNYVDPTGMDRYYVDSLGIVTRIEQSKDVVLISQCGAKTSLKDSTLISKLLTTTDGRSFGRSEDASSAYQLFKFLADNCVVEWSIHFDNSGGATVGTNHNTENAANWSSYGLTERPLRSIHSHPGINPNPVDEISSMGYYIVNPNNYREVQRIYDSDWDHLITSPNQMARSVYVYFPNTGNTYYISKNGWRKM